MALEVVFARGVLHVLQDRRAVGDGLGLLPGLERVAQRVHVRIGADAGVAEQVPGAAEALAAFEDDEAAVGAALAQVHRRADARQAGADHQHVEVFDRHVVGTRCGFE